MNIVAIQKLLEKHGLPESCDIKRIGSSLGNNINLQINLSNDEGSFVIKLEKMNDAPNQKPGLLRSLRQSAMQQYFLEDYINFQPDIVFSDDFMTGGMEPFALSVTEFADSGDLRAERQRLAYQEASPEQIIANASRRMVQMIHLYWMLNKQGCATLDIKLTNLLINDRNGLSISDMKEIFSMEHPPPGFECTPLYKPP